MGTTPTSQVRRLPLARPGGSVSRCREFTRAALLDWGWLPTSDRERLTAAEDVLLMVGELVTNACLHAPGPYELALLRRDGRLRVEVADAGPELPALRRPRPAALPGGHGLTVVSLLSAAWGSEPTPHGKTVWLEVDFPPAG
ncbi:ATP-binding protein [Kitasatospora sp. NPDC051853]|uniref:ATP-binding protein n=1 Tax=Kitasatospora sp. NPDC051853 TaxID=3364058 RepID=UPI00378DCA7A